MVATLQAILCVMMIRTVISLNYLAFAKKEIHSGTGGPTIGQRSLRRVLASLANAKLYITSGDRKSIDTLELTKTKGLLDVLARRKYDAKGINYLLRLPEELQEGQEPDVMRKPNETVPVDVPEQTIQDLNVHQKLVENELQDTMAKQSSALLHNAWVQKRGRNDFLVLEDEAKDPFVTVIPNNIYYNIEKKCVNWMDDCSLQGIRAKLLQHVQSPYKKNMLFFLILIAFIDMSLTKDDYQLVATALYYSDAQGRVLLVTRESLPKEVTQVIEDDVKTRLKMDLPISVVPAYNNVDDVPYRRHVIKHLKKKFPALYNANISREKSVNMFSNMRKYMLSPLQKYWLRKKRRPRPEWDDTPTSNDEEDIPSVRPPKPKSGEAVGPSHSKNSDDSGLPKPGDGDNGEKDNTPYLVYHPDKGDKDNDPNDNHNKPNGENDTLNPHTTNFSYIDPGSHGRPDEKDNGSNGNHDNLKPYTTNFSYLDPGSHGRPDDKDNGSNGNHDNLKPYTTNFSYIDPGSHGRPDDKDNGSNGKHDNLKPYTTNFSYIDNGPNGTHDNLRPSTTNFSYISPWDNMKSTNSYDPLRPYTTNFSYIDSWNNGKPTDPSNTMDSLRPYDSGGYKTPEVVGTPPPTKGSWSQDEFIPNDIYYGIEKTCANWNPLCDLRSPGLDSIPASYVKFPNLINPPILQWVP